MADQQLTQKDLDLVDDGAADTDAVDTSGKQADDDKAAADKQAAKDDKPATDKTAAKGGSIFDEDDDDDDAKGKAADKTADKDGASDDKTDKDATEEKKDDTAADAAWRDRVADRLLAKAKDTMPAGKFEKRREQVLKQLGRYKSADDAILSGFQAIEKIRSGDHKRLPTDASDEQAAAWRKENGIPAAPDAYTIEITGHEWTEADAPTLDAFKQVAHKANLNQDQVTALAAWKVQEDARVAGEYEAKLKRLETDDRDACDDRLRAEFGIGELKPSKAIMKRLLEDGDVFGEAGKKIIASYYYDDDTGMYRRLTSMPDIARGLIQLAMDRYGDGPMEAGDARTGAASDIEKYEKLMKTDYDEYVRSGAADKLMKLRQEQEERSAKRARR